MKKIVFLIIIAGLISGCTVKAEFDNSTARTLYGQLSDQADSFNWDLPVLIFSNSSAQAMAKNKGIKGTNTLHFRYWDANYDTYSEYADLTNASFYGYGTNLLKAGVIFITNTNRNNYYVVTNSEFAL